MRYRRRPGTRVIAVRLDLEMDGFTYRKWGATQTCKPGDWVVLNGDDTYTVDADTFAATYVSVGDGVYEKRGYVWAEPATEAGEIATKEGATHFAAGDYLVFNDEDGADGYAVSRRRFHELYEPAD